MKNIPGTEYIHYHADQNKYYVVYKRKYKGRGHTLIEALMQRDWCVKNNWESYPVILETHSQEKYIHKFKDVWGVGKKINGKMKYYGFFKDLPEAINYRDYIIQHGWSSNHMYNKAFPNPLKYIRVMNYKSKKSYEVTVTINGRPTYIGSYNDLETAIIERDLAVKYDGDWDLICEHSDSEEVNWLEGNLSTKNQFEKQNRGASDVFWAARNGLIKGGVDEI